MAGHALVVDGGHLAPGGERVDALRHRPPHPAGAAEVLARPGVVDAAVGGRRDAALDPPDLLGDVEVGAVQLGDGPVGQLPASSRGTPPCRGCGGPGRRRARRPRRRPCRRARSCRRRRASRLSRRASSSKPQAYVSSRSTVGAEEVARGQLVPLAADGLLLAAERRQLVAQERGRSRAVAARAAVGAAVQVGAQRCPAAAGSRRRGGQAGPEVVAVRVGPDVALLGHLEHLVPAPRRARARPPRSSVRLHCGQRRRHGRPAGPRCSPRPPRPRSASGRRAAHVVQRAGDDVELAGRRRRRRTAPGPARAAPASPPWRPVRRSSAGSTAVELGQRAPVQVGQGGVALGREVGQLVVVAGDADVGRADRVQGAPTRRRSGSAMSSMCPTRRP